MNHKYSNINFKDLKAESVLSLYDLQNFVVEMKGIFYRNYSPDLMSDPNEKETIELSRDGISHLLPEGLFFSENDFKDSTIFEEKKRNRRNFFQPFDNEYFSISLDLEKEINHISEKSLFSLIDFLSQNTIQTTEEDMINFFNVSALVSAIRGNEMLIIDILKIILNIQKIELIKINTACGFAQKRFIIHIPNLSTEQYIEKKHHISKIFEVLKEYFLPFEVEYDFKIKDRQQKFILNGKLILDYNTNI